MPSRTATNTEGEREHRTIPKPERRKIEKERTNQDGESPTTGPIRENAEQPGDRDPWKRWNHQPGNKGVTVKLETFTEGHPE